MHTRERRSFGSTRGFSLVELILMVAVVAILAGIAIPIYADMHERSRVGKAPADPRAAASASAVSGASCGHVSPSSRTGPACAPRPGGTVADP